MATPDDTRIVARLLSNHFTDNPDVEARYFQDAEFKSQVHVFRQLMNETCAAARRNGVPVNTTERILAQVITEFLTI